MAGGLKATATDTAYVLRQNLLKPGHLEYIPVVPSKNGSMQLKAGDHLRVFDRAELYGDFMLSSKNFGQANTFR